jgi:hypothetical protein
LAENEPSLPSFQTTHRFPKLDNSIESWCHAVSIFPADGHQAPEHRLYCSETGRIHAPHLTGPNMPEEETQVAITRTDKGSDTGWVMFAPCPDRAPPPEETLVYLEKTAARWLRQNPNIKAREMLGLVQDGNTVGTGSGYTWIAVINVHKQMLRPTCVTSRPTPLRIVDNTPSSAEIRRPSAGQGMVLAKRTRPEES